MTGEIAMKEIKYIYSPDGVIISGDLKQKPIELLTNKNLASLNGEIYLKEINKTKNNIEETYIDISSLKNVIDLAYKDTLTGYYSKNYLCSSHKLQCYIH